ncbi:hypothetical protein [Stutzerimonas chloritidismutans]|uniref:hypothetical protein n=1 Tax=Stutzerimonas chloritidismutans TaxID=203192 RepID=UPI003F1707BB
MDTIVIRYFERTKDLESGSVTQALIGTETFNSISEALLPSKGEHSVYLIKKFSNDSHYRWFVEDVALASERDATPAIYTVVLSKPFSSGIREEYLRHTLAKTGQSLERVIRMGTLVDVDYGFIQNVAREDGEMRTNKRYCDTLQKGEMHKRRLAVVISAKRGKVQVVPVTSQAPNGDRTCFQLSRQTLEKLAAWGTSGKESWVLTGMIESISPCRILPPITFFQRGNERPRRGRDPKYQTWLTNAEIGEMKTCLAHSVGLSDYQQTKDRAADLTKELAAAAAANNELVAELARLGAVLATTEASLAAAKADNRELELVKEVAVGWGKGLGDGVLETEVSALRDLYQEMDSLPAAANDAQA